ncbi:MAG: SUMF1/EgtB/PvdO family nonheme iron enzyme [Gammaproteobacteria bacterium]|nr:SUMF1/EgtB/PvdO family nonheme iron enzyme [Gammaproteobacteria bacterium]
MGVVPNDNTVQLLKKLVPLNLLSEEDFEQLLQSASFNRDKSGTYLFRQGDTDYHNVYLLSGQVALLDKMREVDRVTAGSETARFPLAHQIPRKNSVRAVGRVEYVLIDNRKLSELLVRSSDDAYKVTDLNTAVTDDWMTQLLQSNVFQQIPAANIQGVIMRMEEVEVKRGQSVIKQGGEGDYFYLINHGQCVVQRKEEGADKPAKLAKLGPGDSFGEEALLSDSPRNSSVRMLTNGTLLRLAKEDFIEFVKRPLARGVGYKEALSLVKGGAVWLDVRPPEEYESGHIGKSVSLPLNTLRYQAPNLAVDQHYVICCGDGQMSATAAFLLTDRGYSVSVLEGGLRSVSADILIQGGQETETSAKVISLHSGEELDEDAAPANNMEELDYLREMLAEANNKIKQLGMRFHGYKDKQQKEAVQRQAELKAQKVILDSTRSRLEELRGKRNAEKKSLDQLELGRNTLNTTLEDALEELSKASSSISDLEAKLQTQQDSNHELLKEKDDLQEALDRGQKEQEQQHRAALAGLEDELALSQNTLEEVVATRAVLEKTIEDLRQGQIGIEQQHTGAVSEMEQQLEKLCQELAASEDKNKSTLTELEQLNKKVNESEVGLEALQQVRLESEAKLQEQQQVHEQGGVELKDSLHQIESELEELKASSNKAKTALQHERVLRQDAEDKLQQVVASTASDDQGDVGVLKLELVSLTEALKEADFAYDEIREQAEAVSEELKLVQLHSNKELELLNTALETARADLKEIEVTRGFEKADEESLRLELDELRESSRRWEQRLTKADSKCRGFEDAIEDRDEKIDQITLELDEVKLKYGEMESICRQHEDELNLLQESARQETTTNEYVDPRLAGPSSDLYLDDLYSEPSSRGAMLLGLFLGVVICFTVVDGVMILAGRGELVTGLLQGDSAMRLERAPAVTVKLEPASSDRRVAGNTPVPERALRTAPAAHSVIAEVKPIPAPEEVAAEDAEQDPVWSMLTDIEFGPAMVRLKGGSFTMGSNTNQVSGDEWPAHTINISAFAISREEVTFDEYDRFAQATGRRLPNDEGWGRVRQPVINVSWDDAVAYAEWLSERTGKNYRLPTEAEWEFAVRGGSDSLYWWGYQVGDARANCFDCGSQWDRRSSAPVGSFQPNNFGLHDMAGNVREWVQDCYHPNYSGAPADGSAWLDPGCAVRVVRGGAYNKTSDSMRSAWRGYFKQDSRLSVTGFRVVRELQ